MLKKSYHKTILEMLKLCLQHDKYLNSLGNIAKMPMAQQEIMQMKEKKMISKIKRLRNEKIALGSLLRIIRCSKYENLTDDLVEVEQLRKRLPQLKNFSSHLTEKRDESRSKGRDMSPMVDTPAFRLKVQGYRRRI
jgi:hypothetical protein